MKLLQLSLPFVNLALLLLAFALIVGIVKTYLVMMIKKPDKYRTAEVFSVLKSVGIPVRKKAILTMREQPMFAQLVRAFPSHIILAQVSFQALLDTSDRATRNRFDRKYADFVVFTKAFNSIAIVELDDATYDNKAKSDAERDHLLKTAGYPVKVMAHTETN